MLKQMTCRARSVLKKFGNASQASSVGLSLTCRLAQSHGDASVAYSTRHLPSLLFCFVGYFDLDPARTLDLILDAFVANVVSHHRFFVDLLRCSTWGPSSILTASIPAPSDEEELSEERGSPVMAQVLGFKFQHYQDQAVLRSGEEAPRELYLVSAIMIRKNLIKLKDLWNHVSLLFELSLGLLFRLIMKLSTAHR